MTFDIRLRKHSDRSDVFIKALTHRFAEKEKDKNSYIRGEKREIQLHAGREREIHLHPGREREIQLHQER